MTRGEGATPVREHVLVTGGAGYLGSVLCEHLLAAGHRVTVVDNLSHGQGSLFHLCADPRFAFVRGDVRDRGLMERLVRSVDAIVPLAAIVGAPACDRDTRLAREVNLDAVVMLNRLRSRDQLVVFPTTNSGYGARSGDVYCTEETPLEPVSLYGQTKVEAEAALLATPNVVSFRLATVFGTSPRMRLDLLVNHFVYAAITDGYLVVFEKDAKRNYVHIRDVADGILYAMHNARADGRAALQPRARGGQPLQGRARVRGPAPRADLLRPLRGGRTRSRPPQLHRLEPAAARGGVRGETLARRRHRGALEGLRHARPVGAQERMTTFGDATAVVLAGGLGTRLRATVSDRPKVLAEVRGRPFLAHLLDRLCAAGVGEIVISIGYRGADVRAAFGTAYRGRPLRYAEEPSPLGTAGALRALLPELDSDPMLVLNGDSWCEVDLAELWRWHATRGANATLCLTHVADTRRFGRVAVNEHGGIEGFVEKGDALEAGWINAGVYVFSQAVLGVIPPGRPVSLEREILPAWIGRGLYGMRVAGRFIDIGTADSYRAAQALEVWP
jgi:nucleoside-diphosphate-sugar epimerase/dTDP-glucose pyrophosphorylase